MRSLDLPQILYQPFAATGNKNTILNSPSTDDPQRANLQTGFPPITQIPIANGGIPPERKDFNGLGYLLSSFYFFTQCGGVYTFNRNVSNAIGGYPLGAVLYYTDSNGTTYKVRSLLENNTFDFVTTPSYIDDEHWEYVSSTPITQDTSASSASNVFSTAAAQSLLNTVVHKTGNETISGVKTFINHIEKQVNVIRGQAPSSSLFDHINFCDKNNNWLSGLEYNINTDKSSQISLVISDSVEDTTNVKGMINLGVYSDGNVYTYAPPSDAIGSIVTTTGINKSPNGYVKLGNGLIIQWGRVSGILSNQETTVTFSTAFTSGNSYTIVKNYQSQETSTAADREMSFYDFTTTTAKTYTSYADTSEFSWLAIGY